MLFRMILAACAGCLFATAVAAQTQTPTEAEIIRLLKMDSGNSDSCGMTAFTGITVNSSSPLIKGVNEEITKESLYAAQKFSGCALSYKSGDMFIKFIEDTGINLMFYTLYSSDATVGRKKIKERVIAYLTFARDKGRDSAGIWLSLFMRGSKLPIARKDEQPEVTLQASAAMAMNEGNNRAFFKKYGGKTLQIDGPVSKVTEVGVNFDAKTIGEGLGKTTVHAVYCYISDLKERRKLDDVMPGTNLTVKGIYFGVINHYRQPGVELVACHIVSSSTPAFGAPTQQ